MYQRNGHWQTDDAEQVLTHTLDQAFGLFALKDPPQPPTLRSRMASAAPNLEAEPSLRPREQFCRIMAKEVKQECAKCSYEAAQHAAEKAHSDRFIAGTAEIEMGMRNVLFQNMGAILAVLAERKTLGKGSYCSIEG